MPRSIPPGESKLKSFLAHLGLSPDQATLYHTLIKHGPLTILELSRNSGIPRTRVYRTLEAMRTQKLVEEIIDEHRTLAAAVPPDRLEKLLEAKQAKVQELESLFPEVQTYLHQQINRRQPDTKVLYYKGPDSIQQMAYNALRAQKEIVGYTYRSWLEATGQKTFLYFYEEIVANQITIKDIYSDEYLTSIGGVEKISNETPNIPGLKNLLESKYLPSEKLTIDHQLDIYNDVIALYTWKGDDIFGVEIYNPKVAHLQKQIFNLLWEIAVPETELANLS